jgi:methylmalonyl-CoA epimerase
MARAPLRVDHVSIAVESIDRALEFFLRYFPARLTRPKDAGYGDPPEFHWANFSIGDFKIELIESARPGSFVERYLAARGQGFHHLSLKIADLDPHLERLESSGVRIVDRFDEGNGHKTAFVSPRSAFGTLIQFWQEPDPAELATPSWGGVVSRDGVSWQVDHVSLALRQVAPAARFLSDYFGAQPEVPLHPGYDGSFRLQQMRIGDYRVELMEAVSSDGFLPRFLARRGEGLHHLSIDVDDLDAALAPFERAGARIVDRFDFAPGRKTAFLHPRSAFGVLIQFWQTPLDHWARAPEMGA